MMASAEVESRTGAEAEEASEVESEGSTLNSTTRKSPSVSVPVLSIMAMSAFGTVSSARRRRTSRPFRAPMDVERAATSGMARPSA